MPSFLIVDDNAFIRKALWPDLIVLDMSMPVMNGLDAARVLKRLMPSVPMIMYS